MKEKLTAYALNEMPPDERAEFEAQMLQDPALKKEAEEMQAFCSLLNEHVIKTDADVLTTEQRAKLTLAFAGKGQTNAKIIRPFWKHPFFISTTAVAACVTIALVRYASPPEPSGYFGDTNRGYAPQPSERVNVSADMADSADDAPAPTSPSHQLPVRPVVSASVATTTLASAEPLPPLPSLQTAVGQMGKKEHQYLAVAPDASSMGQSSGGIRLGGEVKTDTVGLLAEMSKAKEAPAAPAPAAAVAAAPAKPANPAQAVAGDISLAVSKTRAQVDKLNERTRTTGTASAPKEVTLAYDVAPADRFNKPEAAASREAYTAIHENVFLSVADQPLSTFSIDVDTASYANVRRFLNNGQRPPADAVRLEELINYFPYSYEAPSEDKPFGVVVDVAEAPWNPTHRLARVALKGRVTAQQDGAANFVFLVDVSGSMNEPDKLPLVQQSLKMLVGQLRKTDRVALVVYAGSSGLVLPSTAAAEKEALLQAIENLKAGGSTNGAGGIRMAYDQATQHFIKGGVNRVILCTDGDFNVGVSSPAELEKLIAEKAKTGVFLSVLGFGTGNLQDRTMETLADKGNGNYAYIDSLSESRKVLVEQMQGTLVTIAKDVKIQVEFNPAQVSSYRLLGYENRALAKEDFNNDRKDAGEIGAGHTVTALYEIVPANVKLADGKPLVDDLKYAEKLEPAPAAAPAPASPAAESAAAAAPAPASHEMMTVKLRYKQPDGDKSTLLEVPVTDKEMKMEQSPRDFQFAAAVAGFGMLLRDSRHAGEINWEMVRDLALRGKGEDALGYRGEFLQLIDKARGLTEQAR